MIPFLASSHEDKYISHIVNETSVRIKTGYLGFEEIEKTRLISELLDDLRDKHNYCKSLHIDYIHDYTGDYEPVQFMNIGKPLVVQRYNSIISKVENSDGIIIRLVDEEFPILDMMLLIEYAIENEEEIVLNQQQYSWEPLDWIIYSVNQDLISQIKTQSVSEEIKVTTSIPRYRRTSSVFEGFTYYLKNEKYHVCYQFGRKYLPEVDVVKGLYQIENITNKDAIIFDAKDQFMYYSRRKPKIEYDRHKIDKGIDSWQPHEVLATKSDKLIIRYRLYSENPRDYDPGREAIYLTDLDVVIDDFDSIVRDWSDEWRIKNIYK